MNHLYLFEQYNSGILYQDLLDGLDDILSILKDDMFDIQCEYHDSYNRINFMLRHQVMYQFSYTDIKNVLYHLFSYLESFGYKLTSSYIDRSEVDIKSVSGYMILESVELWFDKIKSV